MRARGRTLLKRSNSDATSSDTHEDKKMLLIYYVQ